MNINWTESYRVTADGSFKLYATQDSDYAAKLECNYNAWSLILHHEGVHTFKLNASDSDEAKTEAEAIIREKVMK